MTPSRLTHLSRYAIVVLLATSQLVYARIGGYSHRNTIAATPQPTHAIIPQQEVVIAPETTRQPVATEPLAPAANVLPAQVSAAITPRRTQLPPPPTADNIYELMNLLESQNKQLREQIAMLERESHILMSRNRALRTDKRRLQRKKRKQGERIDALEEQILKTASRPPRMTDGKPPRYSQHTPRT